jgi:hypothetical protein
MPSAGNPLWNTVSEREADDHVNDAGSRGTSFAFKEAHERPSAIRPCR